LQLLLCQTFFFQLLQHIAKGQFLSSARFGVQCGICFCIAHAGWYVDITQVVPNTQTVYNQVAVQILLHYSTVMTLRAGKLLPVLEKHPLHTTQMQAILRFKTECRARIVYSVWRQGYRMADGNSSVLDQDRKCFPFSKASRPVLEPVHLSVETVPGV